MARLFATLHKPMAVHSQAMLRLFPAHRLRALPKGGGTEDGLGESFTGDNFGTIALRWEGATAEDAAEVAALKAARDEDALGTAMDDSEVYDGPQRAVATELHATEPHLLVRIHNANGSVVLRHLLPLGLTAEAEAARYGAACHSLTARDILPQHFLSACTTRRQPITDFLLFCLLTAAPTGGRRLSTCHRPSRAQRPSVCPCWRPRCLERLCSHGYGANGAAGVPRGVDDPATVMVTARQPEYWKWSRRAGDPR